MRQRRIKHASRLHCQLSMCASCHPCTCRRTTHPRTSPSRSGSPDNSPACLSFCRPRILRSKCHLFYCWNRVRMFSTAQLAAKRCTWTSGRENGLQVHVVSSCPHASSKLLVATCMFVILVKKEIFSTAFTLCIAEQSHSQASCCSIPGTGYHNSRRRKLLC
jgi:hypothetical protein